MQDFLMNNLNYILVGSFIMSLFGIAISYTHYRNNLTRIIGHVGILIILAGLIWNVKLQDQAVLYLLNNDNQLMMYIQAIAQRGRGI